MRLLQNVIRVRMAVIGLLFTVVVWLVVMCLNLCRMAVTTRLGPFLKWWISARMAMLVLEVRLLSWTVLQGNALQCLSTVLRRCLFACVVECVSVATWQSWAPSLTLATSIRIHLSEMYLYENQCEGDVIRYSML